MKIEKRILFTAAEQEELLCAMQACRSVHQADNVQADFLLTGIGTTSICYRLSKQLIEAKFNKHPYDFVVNLGVAGSFCIDNIITSLGSTVLVGKEYFGDLGFETPFGFQTLFQSQVIDADLFPFTGGAIERVKLGDSMEAMLKSNFHEVVGVTLQKVTGSHEVKRELINKFSPDIESMEGAACFYVCKMENINFIELRAISNEVGESDRSKWRAANAISSLKEGIIRVYKYYINNDIMV